MITHSDLITFGRAFDHLREKALARAGIRFFERRRRREKPVPGKKGARCGAQARI
jgi:hypothetical protein